MKTNTPFSDLSPDRQMTLDNLRMLAEILWETLCLMFSFFVVIGFILCVFQLKKIDRYMVSQSIEASLKIQLLDREAKQEIRVPNGPPVTLKAVEFMNNPQRRFYVARAKHTLIRALWQSALSSLTVSVLFLIVVWFQTKKEIRQNRITP